LIILDDASPDESGDVIGLYASDPRVTTIFNDRNTGDACHQWRCSILEKWNGLGDVQAKVSRPGDRRELESRVQPGADDLGRGAAPVDERAFPRTREAISLNGRASNPSGCKGSEKLNVTTAAPAFLQRGRVGVLGG